MEAKNLGLHVAGNNDEEREIYSGEDCMLAHYLKKHFNNDIQEQILSYIGEHNVKYEAILAQPINAHEKSLINANEVQNKIIVCLRGKSSFAKKARLCESFGASGVLVVNTLNVWPFTMGDSTGEGKDLNIPTAMCKKNDGERLIEMLKQKKTIGITFNIPEAKDTTCGICLDNYGKGNEIVQLPCLHFFHDKCIAAWFKVNNSCPICRKEIWDDDEKNNEQQY